MTDYDDYEDDDEQEAPGLAGDLRKQLKIQSKKNKELEAKLAELTTKARGTSIKEVFKGAGVDEKFASLVPSNVEPTAEAVGEWLKEYGYFGVTQGTTSSTDEPEDQEVQDQAQKIRQMQDVAATGEIKGQERRVGLADLKATSSEEEVWALIRKATAQGS